MLDLLVRYLVCCVLQGKLQDANEAKRIQREIRVMRHLSHEGVIKLFEVRACMLAWVWLACMAGAGARAACWHGKVPALG